MNRRILSIKKTSTKKWWCVNCDTQICLNYGSIEYLVNDWEKRGKPPQYKQISIERWEKYSEGNVLLGIFFVYSDF